MTAVRDGSVVQTEGQVQSPDAVQPPREHLDAGAPAGVPARDRTLTARSRTVAARAGVWLAATLRVWWSPTPTEAERRAPRVRRSSLWEQAPPSLADIWGYGRAGAWVKGQRHPLLEAAGKTYGAVAVAVVACLRAVEWVVMRPSHLFGSLAFAALLALTWSAGA